MRQNLKTQPSIIHVVSALAVVLLAVAATNDQVTQTATGAFSGITGLESEAALQPETTAEETNTVNLQQGLQGFWRFDDPKVSRGYSLQFDGDDEIALGTNILDNYTGFSTTAWVRLNRTISGDNDDRILGKEDVYLWGITNQSSSSKADIENWLSTSSNWKGDYVATGIIESGKWYFLTSTWNGTHLKQYVDESMVAQYTPATSKLGNSTNNIYIGSRGGSQYLNGEIDSLRIYSHALSSSDIQDLYEERPVSSEGLVLHQDFNEGPENCDLISNSACLKDDSGNSNDGTPQGFDDNLLNTGSGWVQETPLNRPTIKDYSKNTHKGSFYGGNNGKLKNFDFNASSGWTEGRVGDSALKFDGENDYLSVDHSLSRSSFSYSFWFSPPQDWSSGSGREDVYYGADNAFSRPHITFNRENDGRIGAYLTIDGTNTRIKTSTSEWSSDKWYHLVFTFNGSRLYSYVDGIREGSDTQLGSHHEQKAFDLASSGGDDIGRIDDFRIYQRALSSSEVKSLYQGESVTEGLVGRWNFEAGDRKTAYDTSDLGRIGILGTRSVDVDGSKFSFDSDFGVSDEVALSSWVKLNRLGTREDAAESCEHILDSGSFEESGFYWIETGSVKQKVYCDMETAGGGWTRVVDRDYEKEDDCPSEWSSKKSGQVCGPDESGVDYVRFDNLENLTYDEVFIKSKLWEDGSNDAFDSCDSSSGGGGCPSDKEISYNKMIADGISLYSGSQHIHTYAFGHDQSSSYGCPRYGGPSPPEGWSRGEDEEYSCTNTNSNDGWSNNFGISETVRDVTTNSSDFYVTLSSDQSVSNEQQGVEDLEIYVRGSGSSASVSGGDREYYIQEKGEWYKVHEFRRGGSQSLNVKGGDINTEVLVVGGGAGGGSDNAGGGGAGGIIHRKNLVISEGSHPIRVGKGGMGDDGNEQDGQYDSANECPGDDGGNTTAFGLVAMGGGGGAGGAGCDTGGGNVGGSGGGASGETNGAIGEGIQSSLPSGGMGHDGGQDTSGAAGGGGGAGEPGTDANSSDQCGNGGDGYQTDINGTLMYYGGGGGGAPENNQNPDSGWCDGGIGGGGDGGLGTNAEDGTDGLGGGGGGAGYNGDYIGGDGGNGIVIVKYKTDILSGKPSYNLRVKGNQLIAEVEGSTINSRITRGRWQNIGMTYNESYLSVFSNSNIETKKSDDLSINSERRFISGNGLTGKVDEMRIYNRSLSQMEVQRLAFQ